MDERSIAVIEQHLLEDPDPTVRGRIAETIGPHLRSEFFDLFLQAIADPSRLVQAPALLALSDFMGQLDEEQTRTLRRLAAERAKSEDEEVREAALYLVEEYVAKWAGKAREAALKANLSEADSIFGVAVAYAPTSKQGRYYQGTYYLDFVERERGIEILRTHRLLVDVPKLETPPTIDGQWATKPGRARPGSIPSLSMEPRARSCHRWLKPAWCWGIPIRLSTGVCFAPMPIRKAW